MKFTILMPTFNAQRYLVEALESIIAQSATDWELLVLDGGSRDLTETLVRAFAENDPRVQFVPIPGTLPTDRTNLGMKMAQGEYIVVHHADDVSAPHRLETLGRYLDGSPDCLLVGSACHFWLHDVRDPSILGYSGTQSYPASTLEIRARLPFFWCFSLPSIAFRRKPILENSLEFDRRYLFCADYDWFYRASQLGGVANLAEPLLSYRHHSASDGPVHRAEVIAETLAVRRSVVDREFPHLSEADRAFLSTVNLEPVASRLDADGWKQLRSLLDQIRQKTKDQASQAMMKRIHDKYLLDTEPLTGWRRLRRLGQRLFSEHRGKLKR